jgi:hypothetical protein
MEPPRSSNRYALGEGPDPTQVRTVNSEGLDPHGQPRCATHLSQNSHMTVSFNGHTRAHIAAPDQTNATGYGPSCPQGSDEFSKPPESIFCSRPGLLTPFGPRTMQVRSFSSHHITSVPNAIQPDLAPASAATAMLSPMLGSRAAAPLARSRPT